VLNSQLA